jgi:CRP/FNR family transcriptional regulator, cyclic AMP receptor protein
MPALAGAVTDRGVLDRSAREVASGWRLTSKSSSERVCDTRGFGIGAASTQGVTIGRVRILELDPDLGEELEGERFEAARVRCTAELVSPLTGSPWPPASDRTEAGEHFGFLVVRGTIVHRLRLAGRGTVDIVGPGDVVRPWAAPEDIAELVNPSRWQLLDEVELPALDRVFLQEAARWPALLVALANRIGRRTRSLLLRLAVAQIPQLETRLRVVLWDLADRFGRVRQDGILLPVRLRQDVVAALVSASRSAVSRKLASLQREGVLERVPRGWLLCAGPPPELFALEDGLHEGRRVADPHAGL